MQQLRISIFKPGLEKSEKEIVLPLVTIHAGLRFLPREIKASLDREGIDISGCRDLIKEKTVKGTLIDIENPGEKLVISIE